MNAGIFLTILLAGQLHPGDENSGRFVPFLRAKLSAEDYIGLGISPNSHDLAVSLQVGKPAVLWDIKRGKQIRSLEATEMRELNPRRIEFSPDGKYLGIERFENGRFTVMLIDSATGKNLRTFTGFSSQIAQIAFAPDNSTIAVVSGSPHQQGASSTDRVALYDPAWRLDVFELESGKKRTLIDNSRPLSVAYSPDGMTMAVAAWEKDRVILYDIRAGATIWGLHADSPKSVTFSRDGLFIAANSERDEVTVIDVKKGKRIGSTKVKGNGVGMGVIFSKDNKRFVTVGTDEMTLWETKSVRKIDTISYDGQFMAVGGNACATWRTSPNGYEVWDLSPWLQPEIRHEKKR